MDDLILAALYLVIGLFMYRLSQPHLSLFNRPMLKVTMLINGVFALVIIAFLMTPTTISDITVARVLLAILVAFLSEGIAAFDMYVIKGSQKRQPG